MLVTTAAGALFTRPCRLSPLHVFSTTDRHQPQVPDDVDDDVTTTTSGSYVMDMTENDGDWRRQIADIYEGVIV